MKLQQLIENLLSFSAWQTRNEILTLTEFPIRALVISVAKEQRLALKAARIQLRLDVEDVIVNADRDKLRTVLDNLLSNAVKFTAIGRLRDDSRPASAEEPRARVCRHRAKAFPKTSSRVYSRHSSRARREQGGQVAGTGIGLSVVMSVSGARRRD